MESTTKCRGPAAPPSLHLAPPPAAGCFDVIHPSISLRFPVDSGTMSRAAVPLPRVFLQIGFSVRQSRSPRRPGRAKSTFSPGALIEVLDRRTLLSVSFKFNIIEAADAAQCRRR
jgi:hypothetical protein